MRYGERQRPEPREGADCGRLRSLTLPVLYKSLHTDPLPRFFRSFVNEVSRRAFMPVEDDEKEVNVPVNATYLRAIPGGKTEVVSDMPAGAVSMREVETLFREHHDRVFRAAYRITGSVVDAEDVLQTVFLRLSRRGDVNLEPNPGSYLRRAAINAALDLLRQRARTESIPIDDVAPVLEIGRAH